VADHINIQDPDYRGVESQSYRDRLEIEKLRIELKQLRLWYDAIENDLSSIFSRTARGAETELHYKDGSVYVISGVERS
jgi:hypothetical protein